jgi:hypothetical protein
MMEQQQVGQYASDLLSRSESQHDWYSGINSQIANLVLGGLALRQDDVRQAEQYLLSAGDAVGPRSPAISIYGGPGTKLARELLERGDRQPVLTYLQECTKLQNVNRGQLKAWMVQVRQGKIPDFGKMSDFGINLY